MAGQFDVIVDELDYSNQAGLTLDIAAHVAGWKPMLGGKSRGKRKSKRRSRR